MSLIDARGSHEHSRHSKTSKESRYYKTIEHKGNNHQKRRIHVITIKKARDDVESGCSFYQVLKFMPYKCIYLNLNNLFITMKVIYLLKDACINENEAPAMKAVLDIILIWTQMIAKSFNGVGVSQIKTTF